MPYTKHLNESHGTTKCRSLTLKVQLLMVPEHKNQKEVKELSMSPSVDLRSPTPQLRFAGPSRALGNASWY